jgi:hypothetical protein
MYSHIPITEGGAPKALLLTVVSMLQEPVLLSLFTQNQLLAWLYIRLGSLLLGSASQQRFVLCSSYWELVKRRTSQVPVLESELLILNQPVRAYSSIVSYVLPLKTRSPTEKASDWVLESS